MNEQVELNDFRMKLYWYGGLLALPLLVILILANADPQKTVRFNQVLELRQQLNSAGVGQEVIAHLDKVGGQNVSSDELASLQQARGSDLFFMLNSAKYSENLDGQLKESLKDGFVTQAEADAYQKLAARELTRKQVLSQFGY